MGSSEGQDEAALTTFTISIQPEAEAEIRDAYWYYEGKVPGLGDEFSDEVDTCLELIARHPKACAIVEGEIRRMLLHRFPYGIFYMIEEDRIEVFACFHTSRNPEAWRQRV